MHPSSSCNVLFVEHFKDFRSLGSQSLEDQPTHRNEECISSCAAKVHGFSPASPWWDRHRCLHDCCFCSLHEQSFTKPEFPSQEPAPDNTAQNPFQALNHSPRRMAGKLENIIPFQSFEPRLFFLATTAVIRWKYHSVIRAAKWMDQ